ncbi:MAG: hypothetical protein L0H96_24030 [Humibacillus sp.]|nr:hypothetical protein [Humibacillus sp.]MDN5779953.1 hypothetical protein [Humibacillus sp.]
MPEAVAGDTIYATRGATRNQCRFHDTNRATRGATRNQCRFHDTNRATRGATRERVRRRKGRWGAESPRLV